MRALELHRPMPERPLTVLIGALGGQGGGLLVDWLVEAARAAGYPAQSTSTPGVAQRTGATTYYFELYPERCPPAEPAFCLFPSAGDVDLMVALEPTEAGRALALGFVTERTTVISTARRVYGVAEKSVAGDGTIAPEPILAALARASRRLIRLNRPTADGALNAAMLGGIAGSGVLPVETEFYREAIAQRGVAVSPNLAAFESGLATARAGGDDADEPMPLRCAPAPAAFDAEIEQLPSELQPIVGHALARLVDYQNEAYARRYLDRLDALIRVDRETRGAAQRYRLSAEVARRLAAWMSYEDVIRVAQLKTRPGRLQRIRTELGAGASDPLEVVEFLKPGRRELRAILPRPFAAFVRERRDAASSNRGLRLRTTAPWGYFALKCLAGLRWLRPYTVGFAREQALIERWLQAVAAAAKHDQGLADTVAELAVWARGYGAVRERGIAQLESLLTGFDERLRADPSGTVARVRAALHAARFDPDGACRHSPPGAVEPGAIPVNTTEDVR